MDSSGLRLTSSKASEVHTETWVQIRLHLETWTTESFHCWIEKHHRVYFYKLRLPLHWHLRDHGHRIGRSLAKTSLYSTWLCVSYIFIIVSIHCVWYCVEDILIQALFIYQFSKSICELGNEFQWYMWQYHYLLVTRYHDAYMYVVIMSPPKKNSEWAARVKISLQEYNTTRKSGLLCKTDKCIKGAVFTLSNLKLQMKIWRVNSW